MAEKYMPTYHGILRQIAKGALVHADETKGVVKGGGHYVWVFANLTTVAYVYAESRESRFLRICWTGSAAYSCRTSTPRTIRCRALNRNA